MKHLIITIALALTFFVGVSAQSFKREGNTFAQVTNVVTKSDVRTKYTWKVGDKQYPIFLTKRGAVYIVRQSKKTGKEYRQYLSKDLAAQIRKEVRQ